MQKSWVETILEQLLDVSPQYYFCTRDSLFLEHLDLLKDLYAVTFYKIMGSVN